MKQDKWTQQTHQTHVILFVGFLLIPITGIITVLALGI